MPITITTQFDSGNIDVLDANDPSNVRLRVRPDANSDYLQWFHFNASDLSGKSCTFVIENAHLTTYPKGWENYHVVCSADRQHWIRATTTYDGQSLRWTVETDNDQMWFAYFAPYSMEQHADLISAAATAKAVEHRVLGLTAQGRAIDYLQVRELSESQTSGSHPAASDQPRTTPNSEKAQLWLIARQHPGESMAEWFMEGFIDRLLDEDDATSFALRKCADVHLVPNMNPDGSFMGHLRTNSKGVNLNREWASPSIENSPEVYHVLQRMDETGITVALDVHGDEALPYNFIAGTEGVASWNAERNQQLINVKHTWSSINPDFQDVHGYPINKPGAANMTICSNQLAERFRCLAMTLEMPFKDTADTPRNLAGWSPGRSMRLGASFVDIAYLTINNRCLEKA